MMEDMSEKDIKKKIDIFLTPERTKTHGRPIYREEAKSCSLKIEPKDVKDRFWELVYELYMRMNNFVSTKAAKVVESKKHSFIAGVVVSKKRAENE